MLNYTLDFRLGMLINVMLVKRHVYFISNILINTIIGSILKI